MINLKVTLDKAGIKYAQFAREMGLSPQHLYKYTKTNKIGMGWSKAFTQYFNTNNIKIYYIEND